jgi:DNA-binding transcriptional MocR family regulator
MRIAALPAPPALEEVFAAAAAELPRWLDHHSYDPLGLPPLRRAIAARFEQRGLPTRPEQILVTNGALHAVDLTIRAVFSRGRRALVELPSYPVALDALRGAGARLTPVPVTAGG